MKEIFYGYARVSTQHQSIQRQIDNILKEFPQCRIFTDHFTGTTLERPGFHDLLAEVDTALKKKQTPVLVFDEISRLSREEENGYNLYWHLFEKGCKLIFLKQRMLDTVNIQNTIKLVNTGHEIVDVYIEATNKVLKILSRQQIKSAFASAEKEAEFLRQRTRDGIQSKARLLHAQGKAYDGGRPKGTKITTQKQVKVMELIRRYSKDFEGTLSDSDCLGMVNLKLSTDKDLFDKEKKSCSRNSYYKYKKILKSSLTSQ